MSSESEPDDLWGRSRCTPMTAAWNSTGTQPDMRWVVAEDQIRPDEAIDRVAAGSRQIWAETGKKRARTVARVDRSGIRSM